MGISHEIRFQGATAPDWGSIRERLQSAGETPTLRMIDGLPAFPDEVPEAGWKELRVGLAGGMVTLRRTADGFICVAWGTTDDALVRSWNCLAWACAAAGDGGISTSQGFLPAADFARSTGLSPA